MRHEEFQWLFKGKYVIECYFDDQAKEFHDLKLGQMSMDELITKFTHFLRYVLYIREEKAKAQRFIRCLLTYFKERIEYDNLKMMDEVIMKSRIFYQ